jgi:hypothetical protein
VQKFDNQLESFDTAVERDGSGLMMRRGLNTNPSDL